MSYVAFISYSHADSNVARRLHKWLETYRIPQRLVGRESLLGRVPKRLRPIFRDREELPTSADLGDQINAALRVSEALIVICSPRAAASRWVNEEILAFKRLGRSARILCLIVDGEPNASDKPGLADSECFPPALRFHLAEDGTLSTTPAEPIAADIRPGKDRRRDAWLKLAAGLAGVGFDELKQRELQRQLRRAILASAISTVFLVTMAGLAVAAMLARNEAVRQRTMATAERDRAEQNFRDARDAVDRFYTKVSEEQLLKAEGLQPLRAELLHDALDYYRRFLSQRRDDPAFALDAAIVQGNVGGILSEVAGPEEAFQATHEATIALERLHAAAHGDPVITSHLSESLGNEAVNLDRLGRTDEALSAHERAIALFEQLPDASPEKTLAEWQRLLSAKGAFEAKLGRFDDAARSYERGLEAASHVEKELAPLGLGLEVAPGGLLVVTLQEGSPAAQAGVCVGDVISRMADVELEAREAMAIVRTRMKAGVALPVHLMRNGKPKDLTITPVYLGNFIAAATKYNLGYLYLHRLRQPEKARPWLTDAVDEYRRTLLRASAATPDVREGLAVAACVLGTCGHQLGDGKLQEEGMREGTAAAEENVRANPDVPRYRTTAAINLANLSTLLEQEGSLDEAATRCQQAAEHLNAALEIGGNLPSDRFQLIQVLTNLGRILHRKDGPKAAIPTYETAIESLEPLQLGNAGPQSTPLVAAQLHRNYAASLRDSGNLAAAAAAYDTAHRFYAETVAETERPPAWLLKESATLECWRAAVHSRLHDPKSASSAEEAFEANCSSLAAQTADSALVTQARMAAVEAFVGAAMHLLPVDRPAGKAALCKAEDQLAKAVALATDIDAERKQSDPLAAARLLVTGCKLRDSICDGHGPDAWKLLSDCLEAPCLEAVPLEMRIDLAASLCLGGKDEDFLEVARSLRSNPERHAVARERIDTGLKTLVTCGVSDEVIRRMTEVILEPGETGDDGR